MIDVEDFLDDIETMLRARLPAQIAAVEARKVAAGKGVGLPAIPAEVTSENGTSTPWMRQTLDENFAQFPVGILFGVEKIEPQGEGPFTVKKVTFFAEVYMIDGKSDNHGVRRMLRYSQALLEVCEKHYAANRLGATTKISSSEPISFRLNSETSEEVRVGGVKLVATFT